MLHTEPSRIIAALAESDEARLRLSLIPLFLEHPEFAQHVYTAKSISNPKARLTISFYYSAAVWLQQLYTQRIEGLLGKQPPLPDYFSTQLGVQISDNPETILHSLAERHKAMSGEAINWLGTYHHAAQVWIKSLEIQHA